MNFFQQQKLVISTLTPVHIGTGEDYEPGNYIIDKGYLHAFDPSVLVGKLTEHQTNKLLNIVNKDFIELSKLQQFFIENADLSKAIATHRVPVVHGFESYYNNRIGRGLNKLHIERTCQNNHNNQYYIPGSSLKGAIRNSLISALNTQKELTGKQARNLGRSFLPWDKDLKSIRRECKTFHYKLQKLLKYDVGQKRDEDILKFLKCSDLICNNELCDLPSSEIILCVNRKLTINKKGQTASGPTQFLEVIPENRYRSFYTDIRLFNDKTEQLLSRSLYDFKKIAKIINQFHISKFLSEINILNELGFLPENWQQQMQKLFNGELRNRLNQGSAMLLRIGKHGGAVSKTINNLRQIEVTCKGDHGRLIKILQKSTTIWLKSNKEKDETNLLPFGWILLESVDLPEIEDLKIYMLEQTQQLGPTYKKEKELQQIENKHILKNLAKTKKEWEEKQRLENEQKIQREKEQQLRQEAEKQQEKMEQQKQDLLASLSDEQRKIKELELLLEEKKNQQDKTAGGELSILINALLNDSTVLQWDSELKNQLADQLEAAFNFIGWGNKKKKPARVAKVSNLRS